MTKKKLMILSLACLLTMSMCSWTAAASDADLADEAAELADEASDVLDDAEADEEGVAGIYRLTDDAFDNISDEDLSEEQIEMAKDLSGEMRLILREDGTGSLEMFGQGQELEWNDKEIISEGEAVPFTWKDGILTMKPEGGEDMKFRKMTAAELEEESEEGALQPGDYDPDTRAGYYKLSTLEKDGEEIDAAILSLAGLEVYMILNEDNTGCMYMYDTPIELKWDDKQLTLAGDAAEYSYDAGKITLNADGAGMTFVYAGTPDEAPKPAEDDAA